MPSRTALLALLLLFAARSTSAQLVRGTVVDATTLAPVAGAFVSLVDDSNRSIGILTDARGAFALRAPTAGTYRLRIERIGYATEKTAPFTLDESHPRTVPIALDSRAIELGTLRAEGENRCRVAPELGARTAAVWEEIRKALRVANWTAEQSGRTFRVLLHTRTLEPSGMQVLDAQFHPVETTGARPFTTPPLEVLAEHGYVREYPDSINFFAPDADVLLSDAFANSHCFRLVEGQRRLGLRFQPGERRRVSDVIGTLWIDRQTLALEELEFGFDRLPYEGHDSIGGRIRFRTLEDGAVIVDYWRIVSPAWMQVRGRVRPFELREHGGRVLDVFAWRERANARATAVLTGVVHDSVSGGPLGGATITVAGTRRSAHTDEAGRFTVTRVPLGTYMLEIEHPQLDSLPHLFAPPVVTLEPDDTVEIITGTPSHATIRTALCRTHLLPRSVRSNPAIVWGYARDEDYKPLSGVGVTLQWEFAMHAGTLQRIRDGSASTVTSPTGRYVVCGVPAGARGEILLYVDRNRPERRRVVVGPGGIARLDFVLPAPSVGEPQP